jgi:cyclophilin family peptidyl-prolyl cis-trans isomerase
MIKKLALLTCAASLAAFPLAAQEPAKPEYPSPPEIVAKAKADEWVAIAPSDLMVMDLAPLGNKPRRVVIQLMPAPFSQGWVGNMRKLAAAKFWDGTSVNRVQDNYVVQWGDATEKKPLPKGRSDAEIVADQVTDFKRQYPRATPKQISQVRRQAEDTLADSRTIYGNAAAAQKALREVPEDQYSIALNAPSELEASSFSSVGTAVAGWKTIRAAFPATSKAEWKDIYSGSTNFWEGWPLASDRQRAWPVHCYGMVGVGRNLSPDTGTGAELYTVIGHAPRHLDRNIALVGRVIEGIEHLSSLPRGTGALGFYEKDEERVPILSVRIGKDAAELPAYEYLSTESASFAAYADARANRRDPFFIVPAGGADICNIPVPVRRKAQ